VLDGNFQKQMGKSKKQHLREGGGFSTIESGGQELPEWERKEWKGWLQSHEFQEPFPNASIHKFRDDGKDRCR
jgi:hypothetical protein